MNRLAPTIALAFSLALAGSAGAEQFYKWQDETGAWHYTNRPPKDKQAQPVVVNAGAGKQGEPAATPEATKPTDQVASLDPAKQKEQQQMRNDNCTRAKTNVATLESFSTVSTERDGKKVKLNEDEHLAELKKARQQVEIYCK